MPFILWLESLCFLFKFNYIQLYWKYCFIRTYFCNSQSLLVTFLSFLFFWLPGFFLASIRGINILCNFRSHTFYIYIHTYFIFFFFNVLSSQIPMSFPCNLVLSSPTLFFSFFTHQCSNYLQFSDDCNIYIFCFICLFFYMTINYIKLLISFQLSYISKNLPWFVYFLAGVIYLRINLKTCFVEWK